MGFYQDGLISELTFEKPNSNTNHLWTPIRILTEYDYCKLIKKGTNK